MAIDVDTKLGMSAIGYFSSKIIWLKIRGSGKTWRSKIDASGPTNSVFVDQQRW
jgi:hypothetical protein